MDKQEDEAKRFEAIERKMRLFEKRIEGVSAKIYGLNYVRSVQNAFQNQIHKCTQFHQILNEFIEDRIALDDVMKRIKVLFRGHNDLLAGFDRFASSYYELQHRVEYEDARNFVSRVMERFGGESTEFNTFVDIMITFQENNNSYEEVYSTAVRLFQGQQDLLEDYRRYIHLVDGRCCLISGKLGLCEKYAILVYFTG